MQGRRARVTSDLSEFWHGQKTIHLYDPNILACVNWKDVFIALIESQAYIDFNQGLDIRLLTPEKIEYLNQMRYKTIHFAWDNPREDLRDAFCTAKNLLRRATRANISVYILCNNGESVEADIARVEFIKSLNMQPYVMIYRQDTAPLQVRKLKRYANNPYVCWKTPSFKEYDANLKYSKMKPED